MASSLSTKFANGSCAVAAKRPRLTLKAVSKPEVHSFGGMHSPRSPAVAHMSDWTQETVSERVNPPEAFTAALPMVEQRPSVWQTLMSLLVPQESEGNSEDDVPFEYQEEHSRHGWGHWPIAESMAVAKAQKLRSFVGTSVELDG